jgi:hypothetical protein
MRTHFARLLAFAALATAALVIPTTAGAAPAANDDFANAAVISALPFSDVADNSAATLEPGEPQCSSYSQTVWYTFTPATSQVVRVDPGGSSWDSALAVYQSSGGGFGGLGFVGGGCVTFGGSIVFAAQAGTTYYVQAGNFYGGGRLQVNVDAVPPPVNDSFANAKTIRALPLDETTDATASTAEPNEPHDPSCIGPPAASIWYQYTPTTSGSLSARVDSYWSSLAVFTGSTFSDLRSVGCRNFAGQLTFRVDAGTTYYFQLVPLAPIGIGVLTFHLAESPPPVAGLWFSPVDPSVFDSVQFFDQSYDPAASGSPPRPGTSATARRARTRAAARRTATRPTGRTP